ncbi:MAG TPA: MBOAT family O-acyltransferase [Isosphaeraceae bacterium]|jgi:D-alanyl-lipoteichoic acid acyltransferase DltB (MBOAT superfamily)|nr:MBOAT family O-acyltransferase [Isosphaeraceae bacterium]
MLHPVDLYSLRFWGVAAVAVIALTTLSGARARAWAFALVNLAFLALHLDAAAMAVAVGGLLASFLVLRALGAGRPRLASAAVAVGGLAVLGLFVIHKVPGLVGATGGSADRAGLAGLPPILAVVGYSYVALRLVDAGRAVYEGRHPAPDLVATINYLVPFHMLGAGPIQAYDDFVGQPAVPPAPGPSASLRALERIAAGLFKKFVVALTLERVFLTGFLARGPYVFVEMNIQYVWLYLDFSAYSDIAVGLGRLLGFATPENFDRPFVARNSIDYWERWHISLSQFIRRNVFFPLQIRLMRATGGRRPLTAAAPAFLVSFLLCGLWHHVSWNWLAWGAVQGVGLIACNVYRAALLKRLGRKGLNRYMEDPRVRAAMVVLTFEFMAFALLVATYPF